MSKIFKINTSLWGGIFNPIIPVFSRPPNCWSKDHKTDRSYRVSKGYLRYFEPDVFVEAEKGLAEAVGLPSGFMNGHRAKITNLKNFWDRAGSGRDGPTFGLSMSNVLYHSYDTERKFVLREDHRDHFQTCEPRSLKLASLALFGSYFCEGSAAQLQNDFDHVFKPANTTDFKKAWQNRTFEQYSSPISLTAHDLDASGLGSKNPTFFLFDPNSSFDLLDFWNLRAQALCRVYPVPIDYWNDEKLQLTKIAKRHYRPASENRSARGVTIEIARSISNEKLVESLLKDVTACNATDERLFTLKDWRDNVWRDNVWRGHSSDPSSAGVDVSRCFAKDRHLTLEDTDEHYLKVENLSPDFAGTYGSNSFCWINALAFSDRGHQSGMTTTLPFTVTSDIPWRMDLTDKVIINSEGWCVPQRHVDGTDLLEKQKALKCFQVFFEQKGFKVRQSDAGVVAQQMFEVLSREAYGLHAVGLFRSAERLKFLDRHAMGFRVRSQGEDVGEQTFPAKPIGLSSFQAHVKQHGGEGVTRQSLLSRFIACQILQLGVSINCPHCFSENWNDLDEMGYSLRCKLCRKDFPFPADEIDPRSGNWKYRLVGPFATPDFARGAYSTLLTARLLSEVSGNDHQLAFSPGLELNSDNINHEADLVCWLRERGRLGVHNDPKLVFAECKSFASEALKQIDFKRMASLAKSFPDAALVFAVLKDDYSNAEKELAKNFLKRHAGKCCFGRYERAVVFLTGKDLFFEYSLTGYDDSRYNYNDEDSLTDFAAATHRLNL